MATSLLSTGKHSRLDFADVLILYDCWDVRFEERK